MKAETKEENTMLLEQVQQWNAAGLWEKSLRTITALAEEDRDYNLCCVWHSVYMSCSGGVRH